MAEETRPATGTVAERKVRNYPKRRRSWDGSVGLYITVPAAARILGVSPRLVRQLLRERTLRNMAIIRKRPILSKSEVESIQPYIQTILENREHIRVPEAARILGVSPYKVRKMIRNGTLRALPESGKQPILARSDVIRLALELEAENARRAARRRRFGEIIRQRRVEMGKTQEQLAREVGISRAYLYRLENGLFGGINANIANRLAHALGTTWPELRRKAREEEEEHGAGGVHPRAAEEAGRIAERSGLEVRSSPVDHLEDREGGISHREVGRGDVEAYGVGSQSVSQVVAEEGQPCS